MSDDPITIIAPTGRPAKIMQERLTAAAATTIHSTLDLHDRILDMDLGEVELRLLAHDEARRMEIVCIDEEPMAELPVYLREKPHHGQPRSLKETRRSQRKGGKRR